MVWGGGGGGHKGIGQGEAFLAIDSINTIQNAGKQDCEPLVPMLFGQAAISHQPSNGQRCWPFGQAGSPQSFVHVRLTSHLLGKHSQICR